MPTPQPRGVWLLASCVLPVLLVWCRPRLTPTFFPDAADLTLLASVAVGVIVTAVFSSLPIRVFAGVGAGAVLLFLLANFHDNNFRRWFELRDVLLPWSTMIAAGAIVACSMALAARGIARKMRREHSGAV